MSRLKKSATVICCSFLLATGCSSSQSRSNMYPSREGDSTVIKNIFSLLLALVMIASCVVSPFIQSSTVHAETNQEQTNGIVYVNKKLGFSLTIPKSWEGKYTIKEEDGLVQFLFTYEGKINDAIPPLFSISYQPNDGREEGLRWIYKLATKNDMAYYCQYDALHLYRDSIPPGEEQDIVLAMLGQIPEVFDSFKMLGINGAGARGDTAGETKLKEQEPTGGKAEEVTNQETVNGIEYINEELGFALTLPKFWKGHYIVEKNDSGGVTFKFKFDGKVYDDIYLFNILVENREYSKEEQEMMGDIGVLGVKNGKTYLIAPNISIYFHGNYDNYFASVPKEGRKIIEAMSEQEMILKFTVLEAGVAENNKIFAKKAKGDTWKVPKRSTLPNEAKDYSFEEEKTTKIGDEEVVFSIIKTPVNNIQTEVIMKPVSETNYIGINGGFNHQGNGKVEPRSISYNGSSKGHNYNSKEDPETKPESIVSLPTFVTYFDKDLQKTRAEIISVKSMDDINNHFKNQDDNPNQKHNHNSNQIIINAIGGKGYTKKHFGNDQKDYSLAELRRTVLAYKEEQGTVYAYLIITKSFVTVENLKLHVEKLGFTENENIVLDGSGSTSMRVRKPNGELLVDVGTENWGLDNFILNFFTSDANRKVYNMIRVMN